MCFQDKTVHLRHRNSVPNCFNLFDLDYTFVDPVVLIILQSRGDPCVSCDGS